eukprot:g8951.t1
MKWWPGGMAKSCNCVILMARVMIKGKDYGPHPFFFQIRDWNTHATLPGLELRDIGQKLGYNGMDNGGLYITEAIIPRRNLLMKFVNVDRDGNYYEPKSPCPTATAGLGPGLGLPFLGHKSATRARLPSLQGGGLGSAVGLDSNCYGYAPTAHEKAALFNQSTNFGEESVLTQLQKITKPSKRSEAQILDYSSQQFLIFPQMALAFALNFTGHMAKRLYAEAIVEFRSGKFEKLQEIHALTST